MCARFVIYLSISALVCVCVCKCVNDCMCVSMCARAPLSYTIITKTIIMNVFDIQSNFSLLLSCVDHSTFSAFLPFHSHFLIPSTYFPSTSPPRPLPSFSPPPPVPSSSLPPSFHLSVPFPSLPLSTFSPFRLLPSLFPPFLRSVCHYSSFGHHLIPAPTALCSPRTPFSTSEWLSAASLSKASTTFELRSAMKRNSWKFVRKCSWVTAKINK